jgi:hypothetical protein
MIEQYKSLIKKAEARLTVLERGEAAFLGWGLALTGVVLLLSAGIVGTLVRILAVGCLAAAVGLMLHLDRRREN